MNQKRAIFSKTLFKQWYPGFQVHSQVLITSWVAVSTRSVPESTLTKKPSFFNVFPYKRESQHPPRCGRVGSGGLPPSHLGGFDSPHAQLRDLSAAPWEVSPCASVAPGLRHQLPAVHWFPGHQKKKESPNASPFSFSIFSLPTQTTLLKQRLKGKKNKDQKKHCRRIYIDHPFSRNSSC